MRGRGGTIEGLLKDWTSHDLSFFHKPYMNHIIIISSLVYLNLSFIIIMYCHLYIHNSWFAVSRQVRMRSCTLLPAFYRYYSYFVLLVFTFFFSVRIFDRFSFFFCIFFSAMNCNEQIYKLWKTLISFTRFGIEEIYFLLPAKADILGQSRGKFGKG